MTKEKLITPSQVKKKETAQRVISSLGLENIFLPLSEMESFLREEIGLDMDNAKKIIGRWKKVVKK